METYPAYKPSGIEWLGDVPEHWATVKGKWLFVKTDRAVRVEDEVITCFRDGTVTLRKNRRTSGFTESLKEIGYQGIRKGDLVIHAMDGSAGAIGVSDSDGKGSPVYSVCTPQPQSNAHYFAYLLREMARRGWIQALAKGIRERSTDFRFSEFAQQILPLPPLPEQRAIARYLEYMDRRIQRYIEAKERLNGLLEEQKRAVINLAVTRGLDPDAPLKPSGVEWSGDVPAHWEVRRLKHVCRFIYGDSLPSEARVGDEFAVYGSNGPVGSHKSANTLAPCIVIGRKGSFGKVNYSQYAVFAIDTTFYVDRRSTSADIKWLSYSLRTLGLDAITKDSAIPGLDREEAYSTRMAYCDLPEQRRIADHLDRTTSKIDDQIERVEMQIELMKEYRTRLIADVVTGKLDVREAAAGLPDEMDEDELSEGSGEPRGSELAEVR